MNQDKYKLWVSELSALTLEQLTDLNSRIKILFDVSVKEHNGKQDFGLRLLSIICVVLRKNKVETPTPYTLQKSQAYVNAKAKIYDLGLFFESLSQSKLVQDAILKEAVALLYADLFNWQGVAISSHTLLNQVHRIPSTLNKHFPGYAESGLLTKLIKGG
jgi:hypothetical protein